MLDPLKLAQRIIDKRRDDSELVGVHVFRGRPLPMFQPEATSANDILAVAFNDADRQRGVCPTATS